MCLQSHKIGCGDKTCFHRLGHSICSIVATLIIDMISYSYKINLHQIVNGSVRLLAMIKCHPDAM